MASSDGDPGLVAAQLPAPGVAASGVAASGVAPPADRAALADRGAIAVAGDADWLEQAYFEHYRPLVHLATRLVDREAAEEIVQDAFVRTHARLHRVDADKVAGYLRSAVVNGSRSHLRRRRVRRAFVPSRREDAAPAEVDGVARTERDALLAHLRTLPDRQREVLVLRYYLDLSEKEIAEALGISTGSVKTHAHRGLAVLATRLETTP